MCVDADAILTNYSPNVRQKLEIDVEHIRVVNPRTVYAPGLAARAPRAPTAARSVTTASPWWCRGSLA